MIATTSLPGTKLLPNRTAVLNLIPMFPGLIGGILEIRESAGPRSKDRVFRYAVSPMYAKSDWGIAFRLLKPGGLSWYHVCINPDELDECECWGHAKNGVCKHTQAMRGILHDLRGSPYDPREPASGHDSGDDFLGRASDHD